MKPLKPGMPAWPTAGHDKGKPHVIVRVEGEYAYLADGRLRPLEKPKKKKAKHLRAERQILPGLENLTEGSVKNEDIRRVIRRLRNVESRCN